MLLDYHAHVNFAAFRNDADAVVKRALDGGVFMILVGTQIDTSGKAVKMAGQYENGVWAAVGLHPIHLEEAHIDESEEGVNSRFKSRAEVFDPAAYRALAMGRAGSCTPPRPESCRAGSCNPPRPGTTVPERRGTSPRPTVCGAASPGPTIATKVVAIGECGLDYWHIAKGRELGTNAMQIADIKSRQHKTLRQHLDLADELDLPLILHCRGSVSDPTDGYRDMLAILREYTGAGKIKRRGSIHCFVSTAEIAQEFLALGFHIGFTGVITFIKNGVGPYDEVVRSVPLTRILVETDCPYLAPVPMRGRRNEPLYVRYVAEKVAEIKGMEKEKVKEQLFENALAVFHKINPNFSHSERSEAE